MTPRVLVALAEYTERKDSGARLHTHLLIDTLSELGDVTILGIGPEPPVSTAGRARTIWHPIDNANRARRAIQFGRGLLLGRPAILQRSLDQGAAHALVAAAEEVAPDLIVLQRPFYGRMIDVARKMAPTVIDADESTAKVMRLVARHPPSERARARALLEWLVYRRLERSLARADEVWVSSDVEARELGRSVPGIRTRTVPNVVDTPSFKSVRGLPVGSSGASYVGIYSYPPNEQAARWIIERLAPVFASRGLGSIDLIGRLPTSRMRRLAANRPNVRILGEVGEPWPIVRQTGPLIVPLWTGAGTRWKVLEAAAGDIPIVSTAFGVQGLGMRAGIHYLPAESAPEFADATERLRVDAGLRDVLVSEARKLVEARYSRSVATAAISASLGALDPGRPNCRTGADTARQENAGRP